MSLSHASKVGFCVDPMGELRNWKNEALEQQQQQHKNKLTRPPLLCPHCTTASLRPLE